MDSDRRPTDQNLSPETDPSQPSPDDRPTEEPKTTEPMPASKSENVAGHTAEHAPPRAIEPSDDFTSPDPQPQAIPDAAAETGVHPAAADGTPDEPQPAVPDTGVQIDLPTSISEPPVDVLQSAAPVVDGLNPTVSDVVAPSWADVGWPSASGPPVQVSGDTSTPMSDPLPDSGPPAGSTVPDDRTWSEVFHSLGVDSFGTDRGAPGVFDKVDPGTPAGQLIEIPIVKPGEHPRIERMPYFFDTEPERPAFRYLAESDERSPGASPQPEADFSPRAEALLAPTTDGGPPLARPIVQVNLPDAALLRTKEEALAAVAARDEATLDRIAEAKVDHAFWVRACHERAVWGNS